MKKKVIAMIKASSHQFYFVNKIHREYGLDLVIIEDKYLGEFPYFKRLQAKQALGARYNPQPHVSNRIKSKDLVKVNDQIFSDSWLDLDQDIKVFYCKSINSPEVEELLKKEKADIFIDHGTSIVKDHIIDLAPMAINLHWGLSPYYRGTRCTEWALINWDPRNIGVTIHWLTKKIDGGGVISQERVEINENDSVYSINMKLSFAGTQLVLDTLHSINKGAEVHSEQQDHSLGYLTLNRQWTKALKEQIRLIEKEGILEKMIKFPARRELMPIIEAKPKI